MTNGYKLMDNFMNIFQNLYEQLMLEMARPLSKPLLAGQEATNRYVKLLDQLGRYFKLGKGPDGQPLTDNEGNVIPGLDNSTLQHRKLLYFFLTLIKQKVPTVNSTQLKKVNDYANQILTDNGLPAYNGGAKYNLKIA